MKILVIGGCGFIGRHLCIRLIERGFQVLSLGRCTHPVMQHIKHPSIAYTRGDVSDRIAIAKAVNECDAVAHYGAMINVDESIQSPRNFFETNVLGTFNVLDAAKTTEIPMLYKSTSEVYGEVAAPDFADEDYRLAPRSPYAASKVAAELYCRSYATTFGMMVAISRGFNTFGPHQSWAQYGAVIPKFIHAVSEGKAPMVFGDGLQTRDYVYVEDIAEADSMIIERLVSGQVRTGEVFNVCTGKEQRIIDIARSVIDLMGAKELAPASSPPRPGEVRRNVGSFEKIHASLGWSPKVGFAKGLGMTVKWFEENGAR